MNKTISNLLISVGLLATGMLIGGFGIHLQGESRLTAQTKKSNEALATLQKDRASELAHEKTLPDHNGTVSNSYTERVQGWSTYTNKDLGFSFKYPPSWKIIEQSSDPANNYPVKNNLTIEDDEELMPASFWPIWEAIPGECLEPELLISHLQFKHTQTVLRLTHLEIFL